MRSLVVVMMLAGVAHADQKIQSLMPAYQNELTACQVQRNGLEKVANGATALVKTLVGPERDEIERDADRLTKGHALFVAYCGDVDSLLAFLKEQANASYRSVEKEIDTRDNKIRQDRRDAKKLLEELGPITRKMIPKIASRPTAAEPPRRAPAKFPSGRSVELPVLPGAWKIGGTATSDTLSYDDKGVAATVTTRVFAAATCEQQKRFVQKQDTDLDPPKDARIDWAVRSVRKEASGAHVVVTICAQRGNGGIIAVGDIAPDTAAVGEDITRLAFRMVASHDAPKK